MRELSPDERPDNWLAASNDVAPAAFDSVRGYIQARNAGLDPDGAPTDPFEEAPASLDALGDVALAPSCRGRASADRRHDVAAIELPAVAPAGSVLS